ncbi:M20/M25/M40 family metallo-hydrolase [Streptomyces sp. 1331.2]|uniref:M20/M25/M40 family metallo-hydrolase n=1 Tax=Streptomyces sp. 1331.2 TaxID=1938835 RepID=UPI000BD10878|nr:M20/M25/M40 family metallo-hydrolase [Streptomyces sp. 1331.2]SOB88726.1 N-carbamoyl-L-amino-acid hydrolase [Streptomyces sp. 1331.2]
MSATPGVSARRLLDDLDALAAIGGRPDGGVDRVAGTAEDLRARRWLAEQMRARGLLSRTDDIGNVFGHTPNAAKRRLLVGSHTDTVPAGGRLDGAYGVIAALEVLTTLHEHGHPAADALEIVSFWDEEGAQPQSPGGMTGSTALCADPHLAEITGFVELHIEQGPRMELAGQELCVVDGIVGVDRHLIRAVGEPNHAGTTPFPLRKDAGRAMARAAAAAHDLMQSVSDTLVGNIGSFTLEPGAPNVIPGAAHLVLELRSPHEDALTRCAELILEHTRAIAAEEGCTVEHRMLSHKPVVAFDESMRTLVEKVCRSTGRPAGSLYSYAGHDAGVMSAHVPTAMVFVPSTRGVSHSPHEHTPDRLLTQGAQVLLETVIAHHDSH